MRLALALGVVFALAACGSYEPFEPHPIDEIPQGPGLLTGEDGEWNVLGSVDKEPSVPQKKKPPAQAEASSPRLKWD